MNMRNQAMARVRALLDADHRQLKACVRTYGCQQTVADSERMKGMLDQMGYSFTEDTGEADLILFNTCTELIECIKCLMHDQKDPNDVAKNPHEITHGPDALRYFAQTYVLPGGITEEEEEDEEIFAQTDYRTAMCGGRITQSYLNA